jgi:flagellar basal-body rod protein FlgB
VIIQDLSNAGATPSLEYMLRFAGQRQQILAHNIANIDTPNFQGRDVDPKEFQRVLGEAIDKRREKTGGAFGELEIQQTRQIETGKRGSLKLNPGTPTDGVMFHDRNQRDIERMMQDLVENASMYRVAADLLRQQRGQILGAIAQRV